MNVDSNILSQNLDHQQKIIFERQIILQEECAELIQEICKLMRFGYSDDNYQRLIKELGDVVEAVNQLIRHDYVTTDDINKAVEKKNIKLQEWAVYQ